MKKTVSLKGNFNFKKTLKTGKYINGDTVTVYFVENKECEKNQLGICIGRKNGNSVIRNRLKRWIKEIYKEEECKITKNYNIIFLFKKGVEGKTVSFLELKQEMEGLLKKIWGEK